MAHSASADTFEPEGIRTGSTIYYPFASIVFGHDDNVLSEETSPKESDVTIIAAGVDLQILPDNTSGVFEISAEAESGSYKSSEDDDYTDASVVAGYSHLPNDKLKLSASVGYKQLHDPRTPLTLATRPSLDEYTDTSLDGEWYYGVNNFEGADSTVAINNTDRSYDSDRDVNEGKDRTSTQISGLLRFPVAPNTRLRLSGRLIEYDYDVDDSRDSEQFRLMVGADWQASDITMLTAEVGIQEKDFDQSGIDDDDETAWEFGLTWEPEEYNSIEITSSQDFDESITNASHLTIRTIAVTWTYDWEDHIRTTLLVENREETSRFDGPDFVDDIDYVSLSLQYALRKTIQLTGGVSDTSTSSDTPGNSSDKTVISVGVVAAF